MIQKRLAYEPCKWMTCTNQEKELSSKPSFSVDKDDIQTIRVLYISDCNSSGQKIAVWVRVREFKNLIS